jgi:hypothetical protein
MNPQAGFSQISARMSAPGLKRTSFSSLATSHLGRKLTLVSSLDHLVGGRKQPARNAEAEDFRGLTLTASSNRAG